MRLIDADAFRREIDNHWPFTKDEQSKHGIADMAKSTLLVVLNNMPTIEERKRGKWYGEADGYADGELVYDMWYCSFCGKRFEEWDEKPNWNYCPNCGADMRGEDDDIS